jgi:hypothetical protein
LTKVARAAEAEARAEVPAAQVEALAAVQVAVPVVETNDQLDG